MQDRSINMQDRSINMQDRSINMQDNNKKFYGVFKMKKIFLIFIVLLLVFDVLYLLNVFDLFFEHSTAESVSTIIHIAIFLVVIVLSTNLVQVVFRKNSIEKQLEKNEKHLSDIKETFNNTQKRLHFTIENIHESILITDRHGCIIDVNQEAIKTLNKTEQEIIGKKLQDIIYIDQNESLIDFNHIFNNVIENKEYFKLKNVRFHESNTDEIRIIEDGLSPIEDDSGNIIGALLVFRDVTSDIALKQSIDVLKQENDQLQRIEVMGDFISAISHNFANMLTLMTGSVSRIEKAVGGENDEVKQATLEMKNEIEESKEFIKKLSVFSQKTVFERVPVKIDSLIERNRITLLKLFDKTVTFHTNLKSKHSVMIDVVDFDRILLNILSVFRRNENLHISIMTYDEEKYAILQISGKAEKSILNHIFNIEEILSRNDITIDQYYENDMLIVKLFFKL
jgi:PAS domain S-box-containing protein